MVDLQEHNKGGKIYPQNQVLLDSHMPSIPLKHKCLSIILIWVIVSHIKVVVVSKKKMLFCFLLFLIGKNRHGIGKCGYYRLGMGPIFGPLRRAENPLALIIQTNRSEQLV